MQSYRLAVAIASISKTPYSTHREGKKLKNKVPSTSAGPSCQRSGAFQETFSIDHSQFVLAFFFFSLLPSLNLVKLLRYFSQSSQPEMNGSGCTSLPVGLSMLFSSELLGTFKLLQESHTNTIPQFLHQETAASPQTLIKLATQRHKVDSSLVLVL